jgi:hypothetical protein
MINLSYWDKRVENAEREYREYGWRLYHEFQRRQAERSAAERAQDEAILRSSWSRHAHEELANRPERQFWLVPSDYGIFVYQRDKADPIVVAPVPGMPIANTDECAKRLLAHHAADNAARLGTPGPGRCMKLCMAGGAVVAIALCAAPAGYVRMK